MNKALCGMMMSYLFYRNCRNDLESIGFVVNLYGTCVASRNVKGNQQTVTWQIYNFKVSQICANVNKNFFKWCEYKHGNEEIGHVKVTRGKIHNLKYTIPSKIIVEMRNYINGLVQEYPRELNNNVECPWNEKLFENKNHKKELETKDAKTFHTFVMKCMFLAK